MLQVTDLHFAYPDGRQVLNGVDLHLDRGERVALLGPNGAGKTTLICHLNGILAPGSGGTGSGRIVVDGTELSRRTVKEIRRAVGIVFQDPDDQLFMPTVGRDVGFGPANAGVRGEELHRVVEAALQAVGLPGFADRTPDHLSMGEKRRVALAGVLAMQPALLVLDEPSANLDPRARREFAEVLESLDTTILMATHDLPYAAQLCPRAVILDQGQIVADGPTGELLRDEALLAAHRLELPHGFAL